MEYIDTYIEWVRGQASDPEEVDEFFLENIQPAMKNSKQELMEYLKTSLKNTKKVSLRKREEKEK
jgi:hypothetical protein